MNSQPNRSRIARILAQYADMGALDEGEDRARVQAALRNMGRIPPGAADLADELLRDLRAWNACYGHDGYLATGADTADGYAREVARSEVKMLTAIDGAGRRAEAST